MNVGDRVTFSPNTASCDGTISKITERFANEPAWVEVRWDDDQRTEEWVHDLILLPGAKHPEVVAR